MTVEAKAGLLLERQNFGGRSEPNKRTKKPCSFSSGLAETKVSRNAPSLLKKR